MDIVTGFRHEQRSCGNWLYYEVTELSGLKRGISEDINTCVSQIASFPGIAEEEAVTDDPMLNLRYF